MINIFLLLLNFMLLKCSIFSSFMVLLSKSALAESNMSNLVLSTLSDTLNSNIYEPLDFTIKAYSESTISQVLPPLWAEISDLTSDNFLVDSNGNIVIDA
jgi:hypothetical protein